METSNGEFQYDSELAQRLAQNGEIEKFEEPYDEGAGVLLNGWATYFVSTDGLKWKEALSDVQENIKK